MISTLNHFPYRPIWQRLGAYCRQFLLGFWLVLFGLSTPDAFAATLVIVNKSGDNVALVNPSTYDVIDRVPTGHAPHEVTVSRNEQRAFVGNYGSGSNPGHSLSVIDLETREERRIALPGLYRPHGIVTRKGKVYFTVEGSRAIASFDPEKERVDWVMGTGQSVTHMLTLTPDARKIYTANIGSDTVTSIELGDTPGQADVRQISTGEGPEGMDLSPNGRELWVAHRADGRLSIIDTGNDRIQETINVGQMPIRVRFTPDGTHVLISDARTNELIVVEAKDREVIKRIDIGAFPVGILIPPEGNRAFVAATGADKVVVIDLGQLKVKTSFSPGDEPDGMAWLERDIRQ